MALIYSEAKTNAELTYPVCFENWDSGKTDDENYTAMSQLDLEIGIDEEIMGDDKDFEDRRDELVTWWKTNGYVQGQQNPTGDTIWNLFAYMWMKIQEKWDGTEWI